ncbi:type VI secretion system Vgr family protein [Erythrobacter sp. JK5]|uniref:type VI secretion system Vgr family protein n=1 Tax=Erythrobacter sp. JK5 TaxID=2829500 RepID=UPI001BAB8B9E|nr:type VI secretion system tip protein TssI/VgrG [Erythrobacter sp. JK5]QUL36778.1 type VI secretion system tip protein VgrG [Erythrobacter sp. JK5]
MTTQRQPEGGGSASEHRETRIIAGLGGEQVEFLGMTTREAISEPFEVELKIVATLKEIDFSSHLGENIAIEMSEENKPVRFVNGILTESVFLREELDGYYYSLTLHPFTHFMDSQHGFAIYQEQSVVDIIKDVFQRAGMSTGDYDLRLAGSYPQYEYCVQYAESDFNFISRLMEQEGLYYWFEHSDSKHVMVICDKASKHKAGKVETLTFNPSATSTLSYRVGEGLGGQHILEAWTERVSSSGHERVSLRDYDFKKPDKAVDGTATDKKQHPHDSKEFYDYPGRFIEENEAKRYSQVRLEEFRALRRTFTGQTSAKGICAGDTVKIDNHPTDWFNGEFLIISTFHSLRSQGYHSGTGNRDHDTVNFIAIPAETQYRARRLTPKPRVIGVESAIVTGPAGESIYTDEYGRIKVRFHWDRAQTQDEQSTCWIRVSQTGGLGNVILPRVGHEVLVDFLHGDPDQPVITGRVFNQEHMPVYDLPANKTRALWRTLSYGNMNPSYPQAEKLDTGEPKANEIRFEDKGGEEEIFVHAERDMNVRVRYDMTRHVGHNEEIKVFYDSDRYVKNDEKEKIDGNREYELKKNEKNTITEGSRTTTINKGDDTLTVDMGNISIKASMGKIKIEAFQEIELKVGKSSLKLTQTNLDGKALMANFKGDAMTEVSAGGILTEKGALIKIN